MSPTITKIATALLKAQTTMGNAAKGAKNPFFKSFYADLNSIREAALPALNAVGVSVLQPIVNVAEASYVRTLLLHESGEWLASDTRIVTAKEKDPQAYGSAISYARRYGLQALLNIGAVDDDGERAVTRAATNVNDTNIAAPASPVATKTSVPVAVTTTSKVLAPTTIEAPAAQAEATRRPRTFKKSMANGTEAVAKSGDGF